MSAKDWRMVAQCADCPFAEDGPGRYLRTTLGTRRWKEITTGLKRDSHFFCHKTTAETGDGSNKVCAGSLEWSEAHGVSQNYVRVCERIDAMFSERRKEKVS